MPGQATLANVEIRGAELKWTEELLTPGAVAFIAQLHRAFEVRRLDLLEQRRQAQRSFDDGDLPGFLPETSHIRAAQWSVAPVDDASPDLSNHAIADMEDTLSPTWENVIAAHAHMTHATAHGRSGGAFFRPRGWHLVERHVVVDGEPVSASIFDFALFFYHSVARLLRDGRTPVLSLPKLESHLEARLWHDILQYVEQAAALPMGTVRAVVLLETVPAAFEVDEILFELRHRIAGVSAGRRDYTFSFMKKFRSRPELVLADHREINPETPFMAALTHHMQQTCARRGARMFGQGAATGAASDAATGRRIAARDLLDPRIPGASMSAAAASASIDVALRYLVAWLDGVGAIPIENTLTDMATAEVCRSQLWLWVHHGVPLQDGGLMSPDRYRELRARAVERLGPLEGVDEAAALLDGIVLAPQFIPYLTFPAYICLMARA